MGSPTGREPYGDTVPVVVAGVTTCQGGREGVREEPAGKASQTTHQLKSGGYGLGCGAHRPVSRSGTPRRDDSARQEATANAHGVVVAIPQEQSWTPSPSIGQVVNVGTVRRCPRLVQPVRERAGALSAVDAGQGGEAP